MKKDIIISPVFYMGNKKKLIQKGLVDLFPEKINAFVEPFCGSSIVSMNVKANEYILNDNNIHLFNILKMFQNTSAEQIISFIEEQIEKFGLPKERTKRNVFLDLEKIQQYKKSYINFRNHYNKNQNSLSLYTLMFFAFSQQMRFNSKGEFNMPFGNDCFSEKNKQYIQKGVSFFSKAKVYLFCNDYDFVLGIVLSEFDKNKQKDNFIYFDPPYLDTTATYNENNGWTISDEKQLQNVCDKLTKDNIKWGMSNVFENKGKVNQQLIDWVQKNNYKVYTFDKFSYMACGKGDSKAKEVYICNYKNEV